MPESAPVTDWPMRLLLIGILLAMLAFVLYLLRRRWNRLTKESEARYSPITELAPEGFLPDESVSGLFLGTSPMGNWLQRVMSQGLGVRSRAVVQWAPEGIFISRSGETDIFIGRDHIVEAAFGRGVAGTVRSKDSVLVIRWKLGEAILDSGFRADTTEGHHKLEELSEQIAERSSRNP